MSGLLRWSAKGGSDDVNTPPLAGTTPPLPQQPRKKNFDSGIKLLHNSENSIVDIIFIHGLTGNREETWRADGESSPWPQTLLPSKVANARILTFGYDAHVADWRGMVSKNRIGNHSMNLVTSIATHREDDDTNNRPILFVCHSLGGLICEDALVWAQQRPEKHLKQVLNCTRGIVFLGTPHHGSGLAHWAETLAKTIGLIKQTNPEILQVLKTESEVLERVQGGFHTMIRSRAQEGFPPIEITCFYEELPLVGVGVVVPPASAILPGYAPIGIRSNHMDMTRFEGLDDPGFIAVAGELRRWSKELVNTAAQQSLDGGGHAQASHWPKMTPPGSQPNLQTGGAPNQAFSAPAFYKGIDTSQIPEAFAQHLPKPTVGPKERLLLKAAGKGDLPELTRLVRSGADISAVNEDGESALTRAISRRHVHIAKFLLENGAKTEYSGFLIEKPLHMAAKTGNVKIVELLLDHGADVDEQTATGTVLHQAIDSGREDLTNLLLKRDADVNLGASFSVGAYTTPLFAAIARKNEPLIRELLKRGAETDVLQDKLYETFGRLLPKDCDSLLRDWGNGGYGDQARVIRNQYGEAEEKEEALAEALMRAQEKGQREIFQMFLELKEEFGVGK